MSKHMEQQSGGLKSIVSCVRLVGYEGLVNSDRETADELEAAIRDVTMIVRHLIPEESKRGLTYPLIVEPGYDRVFIAGMFFEKLDDETALDTTCRYSTSVLYLSALIQTRFLMEHGFLTKGSVISGGFSAFDGMVFGSSLPHAERTEEDVAYPRIQVDRHVAELFVSSSVGMGLASESEARSAFLEDADGTMYLCIPIAQIVFVRILKALPEAMGCFGPPEYARNDGVRRAIDRYLRVFDGDQRMHEMCRWLLKYHNTVALIPLFTEGPIDEGILEPPAREPSFFERLSSRLRLR